MPARQDAEVRHVVEQELRLLRPAVRRSARVVDELLHEDFVEFGASGRRWSRAEMVAAMLAEGDEPAPLATEVAGTRLAEDVVLVTYVTQRGPRRARRSSLWRRTGKGWRVYFHQGTPVP